MSDVRDFLLPDLGEGLEEGDIVTWLVDVGDHVELNQEIVEVETAKAVVAVPSPFAGTLVEKLGDPGETIEVGSPLCRISVETVAADAGASMTAPAGGEGDSDDAAADEDFLRRAAEVEQLSGIHGEIKGSTSVLDSDEEPQPLVGYGQSGAGVRRRRRGSLGTAESSGHGRAAAAKPLAKPPVRKLAKDLGIDLANVAPGSGPDGVITREDVHAFAGGEGGPSGLAPVDEMSSPRFVSAAAGEKPVPGFRGRTPGEVEHVKGIRKRIIAKMEGSRRDIPEALCSREADLTKLWELRHDLTTQAQQDGFDVKVTPFALVCRATILALRRFPTLNAVYDQAAGEIRLLEQINLGVAVDTDRGLLVPNIKDANTKSTLQFAMETAELARKCRDGSATPAELTGGTFTVDNYGFFGNDDGNPIINAPEAGILGVGTIREKPWVYDGGIAIRRVCKFTLAFDHRLCDGGEAGRFVTYVAELCEQPTRILLYS